MTSLYQRNETVPRVKISPYASPRPDRFLVAVPKPVIAVSQLDVSYAEFIVTASVPVVGISRQRESAAS